MILCTVNYIFLENLWHTFFNVYLTTYNHMICLFKTLPLWEKINYLGFSPKFNHRIIASQGFQIRKDFCDISFRFQDIGITLVLIFFLTVHIFEFFSSAVFTVFKEIILRNSNQFEFFLYLTPLKSYLKNKYSFFNSAHNILDFFCTNFDHCTQIGLEWAIMKIN